MTHTSIYISLIENALRLLEKLSESDVDHMMHDGRYPLAENWDMFLDMQKLEGGLHGWVVYLNREKNFTMRVIFRRYFASIEYKAELFQLSYYVKEIRILVSSFLKQLLRDFDWLLKMGYRETDFVDFRREYGEDGMRRVYWSGQGIQIFPGRTTDDLVTYGVLKAGVLNTERGHMTAESIASMNRYLRKEVVEWKMP